MEMEGKPLADGGMEFLIRMNAEEWKSHQKKHKEQNEKIDEFSLSSPELRWPWDKVKYCVTCSGNRQKYQIEAYGDIAANFEAAATCTTRAGNPSYSMRDGDC